MSEMFAASFPKKLNIEFLSVDYKNVLEPKSLQIILDKYEVLFVVGTQDPQNPNICYVSMEDVIGFNHMERVFSILEQFLSSEELIVFKENLVREFSLQNVIQNLTILDAEVLIGMVNDGIEKLQKKMGKNFSDRIRISLNVHICCLVERLIRKEALDTLDNKKLETEEFTLFANAVRDSFQNIIEALNSGITDKYNLMIITSNVDDGYELASKVEQIRSLNLGNVKLRENTHNLSKLVHVTDEEEKKLKALAAAGIEVEIRAVPNDDKIIIK